MGSIPGLGRSPGEGKGYPLQDSGLENPMGKESDMTEQLSLHFTSPLWFLEKEMATHSSILAWRIPGIRESGVLLSMGSHRVGHD